jgi:hypothetical protein
VYTEERAIVTFFEKYFTSHPRLWQFFFPLGTAAAAAVVCMFVGTFQGRAIYFSQKIIFFFSRIINIL